MCGGFAAYVPQDVSADGDLTSYENVLISAKTVWHASQRKEARIQEVLNFLELYRRENDMVNTFSGRHDARLEIAQRWSTGRKCFFSMNRASASTRMPGASSGA